MLLLHNVLRPAAACSTRLSGMSFTPPLCAFMHSPSQMTDRATMQLSHARRCCRCWKNSFWFVTLLYPRCSMTALQLFSTQTLDSGVYLRSDFSIRFKQLGCQCTCSKAVLFK